MLQRVQLDAAIDQSAYNPNNGRVLRQMMAEALDQHLEFVELRNCVLHHDAIFGEKAIVGFLLFGQKMVVSGFEGQIQFLVRIIVQDAIIAASSSSSSDSQSVCRNKVKSCVAPPGTLSEWASIKPLGATPIWFLRV